MYFEVEGVRVIQPLDPYQEPRLTKPTNEREDLGLLDQLYKIIARRREDYINPMAEGSIS